MWKAQVSVEFLSVIMFLTMAMSVFYVAFQGKSVQYLNEKARDEADFLTEYVATALNAALLAGDGFEKNITLPQSIAGMKYNITVKGGMVMVSYDDNYQFSPTMVNETHGNFYPGKVNIIRNIGGRIYVVVP